LAATDMQIGRICCDAIVTNLFVNL